MNTTYICSCCKQTFAKMCSDEEAWAEKKKYWPGGSEEEYEIVCEDCWQLVHPTKHLPEYIASLWEKKRE
jgi:hypothetical protein